MIEPLAVLRQLEIPAFVVFDGDSDETRAEARTKHENDNMAILRLCGIEDAEAMPESCLKTEHLVMWADNIGTRVSESLGEKQWQQAQERAKAKYNLFAKSMKKNPLFIGFSLEEVREADIECPVLDDLCDRIISFMSAASR